MYLSVIIPAYNEEDNLRRGSLEIVLDYLKKQKFSWEVIIVNDGSTDDTVNLLKKYSVKVINNPHQGKAATVITGALAATGDIILFSDMDQATPISEFDKFLPLFKSGYNIIIISSRSGRKGAPLFRLVLAYCNVILRNLILGLPYKDTQCGFKAFSREAAQRIFKIMLSLRPTKTISGPSVDPGFDVELLYLGRELGFKIVEVPVIWHYQETRRVSFVRDATAGVTGLLLVRWRALTNTYALRNRSGL